MNDTPLLAGAHATDISPDRSLFLYGYPHVPRPSMGVHDPLLASALVVESDAATLAMLSLDVIFVDKALTRRIRDAVTRRTGIPPAHLLVSATHTHSGPVTTAMLSNRADPVVPPPDNAWLDRVVDRAADAVDRAYRARSPAIIALTRADATGIGGNRRSDNGAIDPDVPLLAVRHRDRSDLIAVSLVYCMHPTVLHEDSRLCSADFPAFTRLTLQHRLPGRPVVLYHTGPAGNQSPRRFVNAQSFAEAERLGTLLGERAARSIAATPPDAFSPDWPQAALPLFQSLEPRRFPPPSQAATALESARSRLNDLRERQAPRPAVRTAECDVFGAEEALLLAHAQQDGHIADVLPTVLPAEIQVLRIGRFCCVGLPGELFVEYSLDIKRRSSCPCAVIALANGELQGYVVTREAEREGGYEAGNSMFPPAAGDALVDAAVRGIDRIRLPSATT